MGRQSVLLAGAGRRWLSGTLQGGPTLGGTGTGTVPSVPGGAINVKNAPYNATGNGTTDDGAAIRSAITAAGTGGTVYFPAGTYRYVATTTLSLNGTVMLGAGQTSSIILYESSAFVPVAFSAGNNVAFKSLQIKRNSAVHVVMFPLQAHSGWTFDNVLLDGNRAIDGGATDSYGFQLGATGTLSNVSLLNSTFQNFTQFPLFQASPDTGTTDTFTVRNCLFKNNYHTHLEFNAPSSVMQNLTVENNSFIGQFGPSAGGFGCGFANCKNVTVRYNYFEDGTQEALHIEDRSDNVLVEYNKIVQCGKLHFSQIQIVSASTNVRVQHNVIDGTGAKDGQYIAAVAALGGGGSNPSNVTIDDNTIDQGANLGVYHQVGGVTVTNNRFTPAVSITNGGSTGTINIAGNSVGTSYPAGFPGTGTGGGGTPTLGAPTIGSVTSAASTTSGSINVTASVGDTLVGCVGAENAAPTISGAVTWTQRVAATGSVYPHNVTIWTGPVTSGGTQAITYGGGATVDAIVYVIPGAVSVNATASGGAGGATSQTVSGLTTTAANCLVIGCWGTQFASPDGAAAYTPPGGMTERADLRGSGNFDVITSASEVLATATAGVSRTATSSNAGLGWAGALIALASA